MSRSRVFAILTIIVVAALPAVAARVPSLAAKRMAVESVEKHASDLVSLSERIWGFAETALRETQSSKALADYAEAKGFRVTRGVAGMPTAFVAEYGAGAPVIAILGEYDALPGISQKASPTREALVPGAPGHGCGHNLFGAGSLGAALAVKDLMDQGKVKGTIRFYGTPAEESVGGKLYMVREGLFEDVDVALAWHPDSRRAPTRRAVRRSSISSSSSRGKRPTPRSIPGTAAALPTRRDLHPCRRHDARTRQAVRQDALRHREGGRHAERRSGLREAVWCWLRDFDPRGGGRGLPRLRKAADGAALAADVRLGADHPGRRLRDAGQQAGAAHPRDEPRMAGGDQLQ